MKRFIILCTSCCCFCLLSCQTGLDQAVDRKELFALSPDKRILSLPCLAEQRDGATDILLEDTLRADTTTPHPDFLGDYRCVPLGSTPGFHIENILGMEVDNDRFFVFARDRRNGFRDACFIFDRNGKCLLNIVPPEVNLGNGKIRGELFSMSINRQTKEICLACCFSEHESMIGDSDDGTGMSFYCYYNYKGKFLRKEPIIPHPAGREYFSGDWRVGIYYKVHGGLAGKPQLLLYNEAQKEFRRALLVPDRVDVYGTMEDLLCNAPNGELFYADEHSDTVWQMTPDAVIARYILHGPTMNATVNPYGRDSTYIPGTYTLSKDGRLCRNIGSLSPFLVSNNFMLMTYQRWTGMEWVVDDEESGAGHPAFGKGTRDFFTCIVDRRTNHVRWLHASPIQINNLCRKVTKEIRCPRYVTPKDELVYMEDVNSLKRMAAENQDNNTLTDKEKEFIRKLPMDGNPVLFLVPLKPF